MYYEKNLNALDPVTGIAEASGALFSAIPSIIGLIKPPPKAPLGPTIAQQLAAKEIENKAKQSTMMYYIAGGAGLILLAGLIYLVVRKN